MRLVFSFSATDGKYTEWSLWGECSVTCGGGVQQRSRTCTNPSPQNGGADCSVQGPAKEEQKCNPETCHTFLKMIIITIIVVIIIVITIIIITTLIIRSIKSN